MSLSSKHFLASESLRIATRTQGPPFGTRLSETQCEKIQDDARAHGHRVVHAWSSAILYFSRCVLLKIECLIRFLFLCGNVDRNFLSHRTTIHFSLRQRTNSLLYFPRTDSHLLSLFLVSSTVQERPAVTKPRRGYVTRYFVDHVFPSLQRFPQSWRVPRKCKETNSISSINGRHLIADRKKGIGIAAPCTCTLHVTAKTASVLAIFVSNVA